METVNTVQPVRNTIVHTSTLLLVLCIIDAAFTDLGLRKGLIEESNPLMNIVYESSILAFYAVKILLPTALLSMIHFINPTSIIRNMIVFALVLYLIILSIHIYWVVIVIAFV